MEGETFLATVRGFVGRFTTFAQTEISSAIGWIAVKFGIGDPQTLTEDM